MPTAEKPRWWAVGAAIVGALISALIGAQVALFEPMGRGELAALRRDVTRLDEQFNELRAICRNAILERQEK